MKLSNLRYFTDEVTFDQCAIVDVSISLDTLYEVQMADKELQDEFLLILGRDLFYQIRSMRLNSLGVKE